MILPFSFLSFGGFCRDEPSACIQIDMSPFRFQQFPIHPMGRQRGHRADVIDGLCCTSHPRALQIHRVTFKEFFIEEAVHLTAFKDDGR